MTPSRPPVFQGDDRFAIKRELGRGGMGIVYEAYDRERDESVALKMLHWADASAIYTFKNEFRALADVAHRNLINLYELIAYEDVWLFTMELVQGSNFLEYSQPDGLDVGNLRTALHQLVQGVAALHRAGKVHRDLKPPNVLVSEAGRLVILDFGLVAEIVSPARISTVGGISGTIEYMAPEQAAGERAGPATDWYAVGVLLYESLTGKLPFTGSMAKILAEKQSTDPPHPSTVVSESLPDDLAELCVRLLARDPTDRPSGAEVLRRLRASEPAVVLDPTALPVEEVSLIGRKPHLASLENAFCAAEEGRVVSLCVHGPSGIGKSTLVRHYSDELVRDERAVVLAGRCYVRETVPYKALDGMIDMLSRLLNQLPPQEVESALPEDINALTRVFPVLRRVEMIDKHAAGSLEIADQRELRRRAFAALRDVFESISKARPMVIHLDDLQWADQDSAEVLDDMLQWDGDLRLLFILSFRSEEVPNVPWLQALINRAESATRRALEVGPLTTWEATAFAEQMLRLQVTDTGTFAPTVARESDGNPFLIDQMARFIMETRAPQDPATVGLREMLNARIRKLPDGAQKLVEVLAVAGQPINPEVAYEAAGLTGDERPLVRTLGLSQFVRTGSRGERIELYHDRIRENHVRQLSRQSTQLIHLRLAEILEARGADDPEALFAHFLGAGVKDKAATYAAKAAGVALEALAFERATRFYRQAIDLAGDNAAAAWHAGLGDALANAGRGGEAAQAYLDAANRTGEDPLDLERRAGQQLLLSGRIEEGLGVMSRVLGRVGLKLSSSPWRSLLRLILGRLRMRLRGLHYTERSESDIPVEDLTRIDICWGVAEGLALVDTIEGSAFQTVHLQLALDAGEPNRIARALAIEAGFLASQRKVVRAAGLLRQAEDLARRLDSPYALGLCAIIDGVTAYYDGRWERSLTRCRDAERLLAGRASFVAWQLSITKFYMTQNLYALGDVVQLRELSRTFLQDALERGNLFTAILFRGGWSTLRWLSKDDVGGARHALSLAWEQCRGDAFLIPHYLCMIGQGHLDIYANDAVQGLERVNTLWPGLRKSQLLRIQTARVHSLHLRARCTLGAAELSPKVGALARAAERDARRIERERSLWPRAMAQLLHAGVAATRGNAESAVSFLDQAVRQFEDCHMALWHAVALRRKGQLVGGDAGRSLVSRAGRWMAGQGIADPERMTQMLAPGFNR